MLLWLKLLLLAFLFVITGGSLFTEYFRRHKLLVTLAALIAVVSSIYLGKDVCEDLGHCKGKTPLPVEKEFKLPAEKVWQPRSFKLSLAPSANTPFSRIFKFSFDDELSLEDFKKQQAFQGVVA